MKYCLDCYTPNATNAVRCINCNGLFFSDAVNETNNTVASSEVVCNSCKRFISRHGLVCQFCGCSVQTSVQDEMIERKLKLCHHGGTWDSPVGKPHGKACRESHRSLDPRKGKHDTAATAGEKAHVHAPTRDED